MEWLSLPEEVDVFGGMMNMQLDLRVEADNLERFIKNFAKRGPGISFPRPIRTKGEHTGIAARKVLVEEYEDALPLKYFLTNGGGQYDDQIANAGLNAFLVSHRVVLITIKTYAFSH
jgi:aarF domain-containing kinase